MADKQGKRTTLTPEIAPSAGRIKQAVVKPRARGTLWLIYSPNGVQAIRKAALLKRQKELGFLTLYARASSEREWPCRGRGVGS